MPRSTSKQHPVSPETPTQTKEKTAMPTKKRPVHPETTTLTKETIPMPTKKPITLPTSATTPSTSTLKGTPIMPTKIPIAVPLPAPSTTSSTVVLSTTPPVVNIPSVPAGVLPVHLIDYRGAHPKTGQVAAVPDVVAELSASTTYVSTFGPAAPDAESFVKVLNDAVGWTNLKNTIEVFQGYVRSQEAVAWKAGLAQVDQAKAIYDVVVARNPNVPTQFPALTRLLEVTNAIGKKSAASRKRGKAEGAKKVAAAVAASSGIAVTQAAPANAPTVAQATTAPTVVPGGGTAH